MRGIPLDKITKVSEALYAGDDFFFKKISQNVKFFPKVFLY